MYYEVVESPVRLLGSISQWPAKADTRDLPTWVWDAYEWCERLYLATDLTDAGRFVRLQKGQTLERQLPPSIWAVLRQVLPPAAGVSQLKPWVALAALQFSSRVTVANVEHQLVERAHAQSKAIQHLETMAELSERLDRIPASEYAHIFPDVLAKLPNIQWAVLEMYEAWLKRRFEDIEITLPRTLLGQSSIARLLLDDRHFAWLPRIEAAIKASTRTLIVVSVAHLLQARGIRELLKQAGYKIRLVPKVPNA